MTPSNKAVKRASCRIGSRRGSHASQQLRHASYAAESKEIARSRLPNERRRAWRFTIGEFGAKRSESAAILPAASVSPHAARTSAINFIITGRPPALSNSSCAKRLASSHRLCEISIIARHWPASLGKRHTRVAPIDTVIRLVVSRHV